MNRTELAQKIMQLSRKDRVEIKARAQEIENAKPPRAPPSEKQLAARARFKRLIAKQRKEQGSSNGKKAKGEADIVIDQETARKMAAKIAEKTKGELQKPKHVKRVQRAAAKS